MARLAINGFGRIGRSTLRAAIAQGKLGKAFQVVAINDIDSPKTMAHLLKYDSVHGTLPSRVEHTDKSISVDGYEIQVSCIKDPAQLPWKTSQVDLVLECSGRFTAREGSEKHLQAGAKKVLISSPAKNPDITLNFGINHAKYDPQKHHIVSNASCTTNCLAPVAKVLNDLAGIRAGLMTTIHSYTNDQRILDLPHEDLRRARAAALSMIPTSTGAAKSIGEVIPELKGKLNGLSVRVPTPNVSLVDLTCSMARKTSVEEINRAMKAAAEGPLKAILDYSEELTVSIDFNGNPASSTFDATNTSVLDGDLVKVMAWYDNEWGFSNRMVDLALYISERS
jgi:glyceraldehyde 3-phosphate dehydrogenase